MANPKITSSGYDLFSVNENFLTDLSTEDESMITGGCKGGKSKGGKSKSGKCKGGKSSKSSKSNKGGKCFTPTPVVTPTPGPIGPGE